MGYFLKPFGETLLKTSQTILIFMLFLTGLRTDCEDLVTIRSLTESVELSGNWRIVFADEKAFADPGIDEQTWSVIDIRVGTKLTHKSHLWLRNSFSVAARLKGEPLLLLIGKNEGVYEVYLNGCFIGRHGHMPPHFFQLANLDNVFTLPASLLAYDKPNVLAIRYYRDSLYFVLHDVKIINAQDHFLYTVISKFFNVTLNQIFAGILFFVALFMFFLYFKRRGNPEFLFFALGCLIFANYSAIFYLDFPITDYITATGLTQGTLPLSLFFFILFMVYYFDVFKKKAFFIVAGGFACLTFLGFFLQKDVDGLDDWFRVTLLYLLFTLVVCFSILITALRRRNKNALPVFISMVLLLPMAGYDVYYTVIGLAPLTFLQGIGLMLFVLSMFYSLSNNIMNLYKKLETSSTELLTNKTNLETVLARGKITSDKLTELSTVLNDNVSLNTQLIEAMVAHNNELSVTITNQDKLLGQISHAVKDIITSITVVTDDIGSQSAVTAETSASIEELAANVKSIHNLTEKAESISEKTTSLTMTGQQKIEQSSTAINELKKQAIKIIDIIGIIDEIAERTNLLAINAAIEATRAGNTGKGFAIVAKEIRELALSTRQSSQEIRGAVDGTLRELNDTITHFSDIKVALEEILNIALKTKNIVSEIFEATGEEQKGITEIMKAVGELVRATEDIKTSSLEQKAKSDHIHRSLGELESYTLRINTFIREQEKRNQQLILENEKIKHVSEENLQISTELNASIAIKR